MNTIPNFPTQCPPGTHR